jgi:type VI secretion system secreted protein Hcp
MPIYMQFDGITGSVTTNGHEKWIELDSCGFSTKRTLTSPNGRGNHRESAAPMMTSLAVTKYLDQASSALLGASLWGAPKKVKIDFVKSDENKFETFLQYELENAIVASFDTSATGGEGDARPVETLELNFTKITWATTLPDGKNGPGSPERSGWDLAYGKRG